jgi:hypothetical protein
MFEPIPVADAKQEYSQHIGGELPLGYCWYRVSGLHSVPRRFGGLLFVWAGNDSLNGLYGTKEARL